MWDVNKAQILPSTSWFKSSSLNTRNTENVSMHLSQRPFSSSTTFKGSESWSHQPVLGLLAGDLLAALAAAFLGPKERWDSGTPYRLQSSNNSIEYCCDLRLVANILKRLGLYQKVIIKVSMLQWHQNASECQNTRLGWRLVHAQTLKR